MDYRYLGKSRPHCSPSLEMMFFPNRGIIPFYGRAFQISEKISFTVTKIIPVNSKIWTCSCNTRPGQRLQKTMVMNPLLKLVKDISTPVSFSSGYITSRRLPKKQTRCWTAIGAMHRCPCPPGQGVHGVSALGDGSLFLTNLILIWLFYRWSWTSIFFEIVITLGKWT